MTAAAFGKKTPKTIAGQTPAAPTARESSVRSLSATTPKSATVAHPKMARTALPSDCRRRANIA